MPEALFSAKTPNWLPVVEAYIGGCCGIGGLAFVRVRGCERVENQHDRVNLTLDRVSIQHFAPHDNGFSSFWMTVHGPRIST